MKSAVKQSDFRDGQCQEIDYETGEKTCNIASRIIKLSHYICTLPALVLRGGFHYPAIYVYPILMNYAVEGGRKLKGFITVNTSKNAAVALICGSLLNRGTTVLRRMPRELGGEVCVHNDVRD